MTTSMPPFGFSSSLQDYAIPEKDYLERHDDVHIICTGAVVFNNEGKLLLVQRAKDEKAFPNVWVSLSFSHHLRSVVGANTR
jgi:isopentenyldiphosphate isomerase